MDTLAAWLHEPLLAGSLLLLLLGVVLVQLFVYRRSDERLRRALQAREDDRQQLELVLKASNAARWECHLDSKTFHLSDLYYEQLGYAPGAFAPTLRAWRELLHPDDAEMVKARFRRALEPDSPPYACEYRMRDAQGRWRWMLSQGQVLRRGAQGEPLLMLGTHSDIHQARLQAEAQRQLQDRFHKIFEATPDAIGIRHLASERYIELNPSLLRMLGYDRAEVLDHTAADIDLWVDLDERRAFMKEYGERGQVDGMEIRVRRKDGQQMRGMISARQLVEDGEDCMLFVFHDLTERLELQRQAEAARAQVVAAAAANQAKTEFLSRMSHELRTPMNAVLGFSQLLQHSALLRSEGGQREREQVEAILGAGWHLLNLINDVLDITRIESGHVRVERTELALGTVVLQAAELLAPQAAAAGLAIEAGALQGAGAVKVLGDERRLRQVLVNLFSNAIKYNRPGGVVRVAGDPREDRYLLSIIDTGIGMDEAQLAHLFEPFNRLGRELGAIEGVGIGMALSRNLLELMDGRMSVHSRAGEGTTVTLDLALA